MLGTYSSYSAASTVAQIDVDEIPHNSFWDTGEEREAKMHRIHAYPAKFPAFITSKALSYAKKQNVDVRRVADIFCGCGTVAFEAQRENLAFWGCDINPVATLIARAKSHSYDIRRLNQYAVEIERSMRSASRAVGVSDIAHKRLKYWYPDNQIRNLARTKNAILLATPEGSKYRDFFLCAFSNILKPTSRWLTKSIKPQLDPEKIPAPVFPAFQAQVAAMLKAYAESCDDIKSKAKITTVNFLETTSTEIGTVDMIVTSPPYVTSYEYADLHQLSSLWLGLANDYRDLRNGSIGTTQHDFNFTREVKRLNTSGNDIVFSLYSQDKTAAKSVAKYYLDMQKVAKKCYEILRPGGMAVFVIGNTCYKGVRIDNARHLAESLLDSSFKRVSLAKRVISNKILTPYRTPDGRFSQSNAENEVYGEEFVVIASK